jgi:hypothetical protein
MMMLMNFRVNGAHVTDILFTRSFLRDNEIITVPSADAGSRFPQDCHCNKNGGFTGM